MFPAKNVAVAASLRSRLKEGVEGVYRGTNFLITTFLSDGLAFESRWSDASHLNIYTLSLLRRQTVVEFYQCTS